MTTALDRSSRPIIDVFKARDLAAQAAELASDSGTVHVARSAPELRPFLTRLGGAETFTLEGFERTLDEALAEIDGFDRGARQGRAVPAAADGSHGSDEARIAEFRSRHDKAGAVPEVPLLERLLGVKPGASDVELDAEERARLEKTASPAALVLLELSDAQHGFDAKRAAPYLTALDKHLVRRDEEGVRVEGDAGATKGVAEVKLKDMQTGAWSFAEVRPDGGYSVGVDPSHFYALWFLPRGEPPFFAGTLELTYFKVTTPLTQWLRDDGALRRLLEK